MPCNSNNWFALYLDNCLSVDIPFPASARWAGAEIEAMKPFPVSVVFLEAARFEVAFFAVADFRFAFISVYSGFPVTNSEAPRFDTLYYSKNSSPGRGSN